ncbi:HET-domain-containing protein [Podospora australis]|uniref:HET-domain-containing protein n=1 Tax=Podospora australis TaxID=1536484 RepID=A0AAN6WVD4_9PEZI|nr:HET-domain-containing protein [Podospora australis]
MRLINTATLIFEEFIGSHIPPYAILSHTWEDDEVTFSDFARPYRDRKAGWDKIAQSCRLALKEGLRYAWVDTCCIDKSSSAELTEAINSMFRWYGRAKVCYAYLADLEPGKEMKDCRWFTRGWTLQELIAPKDVYFFDGNWKSIGTKVGMVATLSAITGINIAVLKGWHQLQDVAVAVKMSWAARRNTTRIEDTAYCLLGIFDVNIPLLYGEEMKAFRRLQEEIIKSTADFSIFAWKLPRPDTVTGRIFCGVLATSPAAFANSTTFITRRGEDLRDFSCTNSGVRIQCQVLSDEIPGKRTYGYVLPLNCSFDPKRSVGIRLRKCGPDQFLREDPFELVEYGMLPWPNYPRVRYLLTEVPFIVPMVRGRNFGPEKISERDMTFVIPWLRTHALQIDIPPDMRVHDAWPWSRCDDEDRAFFVISDGPWDTAMMRFTVKIQIAPHGAVGALRDVEFDVVFCALGWSRKDPNQVRYTLLDYGANASQLRDVQSQISDWDHNRYQFAEVLEHYKIPEASESHTELSPASFGGHAVVSFTHEWIYDPSICRNDHWKIKFSIELRDGLADIKAPVWEPGTWMI